MSIIAPNPEMIKANDTLSEAHSDTDMDITATELLGLWEFVVESYDIDEARQESIFYCGIRFDYSICPRCRNVSGDIHQTKRRSIRDMMCFWPYSLFGLRYS